MHPAADGTTARHQAGSVPNPQNRRSTRMTNRTDKGQFAKGTSGNPGGRPKLPEELRELFRAKGPEALEVLTRCLRSTDERIAIAAATAILDRGYGKPTQTIDANINEETVRFYAEVPLP